MQLEYHLALEKAVLEYAATMAAHPNTRTEQIIQIPGWIDDHVWGMAASLSELGHICAIVPEDNKRVSVTDIYEPGTIRLKDLVAQEQVIIDAKTTQMEEAIERARQKKWWRRVLKFGKASA